MVMPLYIPLVAVLISFLLVYKKNKKTKILNRYLFFSFGFLLLVLSELLVRYSGITKLNFYVYLITPLLLLPSLYFILLKKFWKELK